MLPFCSNRARMALDAEVKDHAAGAKVEGYSRATLIVCGGSSARRRDRPGRLCRDTAGGGWPKNRRRAVRCRVGAGESG